MTAWPLLLLLFAPQAPPAGEEAERLKQQIRDALAAQAANRLDEAAAGFQSVLRRLPDLAEAHMSLGMIRHAQQRFSEAIPELETALRLKPELNQARAVVGLDYLRTGEIQKAVEYLEQAVGRDPANPDFNGWLGMAYVGARRFRDAVPRLEAATQAAKGRALFLGFLARAQVGVAAEAYRGLGGSPEAHLALAQAYALSGDRAEAVEEYEAAAGLNPKLPGVHAALGDLRVEAGEFAEAEKAYRKELELAPDSGENQFCVGMVLAELGKPEEALPYLEKAATRSAAADVWFYLGRTQLNLGRVEEARTALLKATEGPLSPKRLTAVHYQLSQAYRRLGKPEDAARHLRIFQQLEAQGKQR